MQRKIWKNAILFTVFVLGLTFLYAYLYFGKISYFVTLQAFGVASLLVIAPSLALSGLAYFWNFADRYVIYRKSVGLLGFYLGLIHVGLSMWDSGILTSAFALESLRDSAIVTGYLAVFFFALMPLVSNISAIRLLGGTRVRLGLRYFGYAAYILVLFHAIVLSLSGWNRWFDSLDPIFPPPTLIACIVAVLVLLLRVALFVAQMMPQRSAVTAQGTKD